MGEIKKLNTGKVENKVGEKMTYEQLENVAHQLSEQSRQLYIKLQEADRNNTYRMLDYLFKVITEDNKYLTTEFKSKCAQEIEFLMTQPEQETPEE